MPMNNKEKQMVKEGSLLWESPGEILASCPALHYDESGYVDAQSQSDLFRYHPEIVLYCPQIPQNTGSISRLCAAFSCTLHLIEPMGFKITEKAVTRAGLDYWDYVNLYHHQSFSDFKKARAGRRLIFIETGGSQAPEQFDFLPGDCLVFGAETFGIHSDIMDQAIQAGLGVKLTIPMFQRGVRSVNLANAVSIVMYQAIASLHGTKVP
jgi:tRNA (cytidine/uridine-2'-O-)-methyltransferase